jgi:uncharacterized protein YdhG (YjbR/CyaY superfamily)
MLAVGQMVKVEGSCSMVIKKEKSRKLRSATKGKERLTSIDEYLVQVPEPARSTLSKVRAAIRSAAPKEATETISYGIPAFKYKRILLWFAAFSDHCSLFPTASVIESFKAELRDYSTSKGTIQFPVDKPLPAALVRKLVKARVSQLDEKPRA